MPPNRDSRYRFTTAYQDEGGRLFLSEREPFGFRDRADNVQHVVRSGDTLDSVAATYFAPLANAAQFWWVIGEYQPDPVLDPTVELAVGSVLVVPSLRVLQEEVLNETRRQAEDHG